MGVEMGCSVHDCPETDRRFKLRPTRLDEQHRARDSGWYIKVNWCCSPRCCSVVHQQLSEREHLILTRFQRLESTTQSREKRRADRSVINHSQVMYAHRALPHYIECVEAFVQGRQKTNLMRLEMEEDTITWEDEALPKLDLRCIRPCDRDKAKTKEVVANIAQYLDDVAGAGEVEDFDTDSYAQYAKIYNFGRIHPAALDEEWLPSVRPAVVAMLPIPVSDSFDIMPL